MLANEKLQQLQQLIQQWSREEIIWTNGYLSGILQQNVPIVPTTTVSIKPSIIYGTETGNSKKIATQLLSYFKKNKIQAKNYDAAQYPVEKIAKEEFIILIISTQGEGELPQNAQNFYQKLQELQPDLSKVSFAVLALGDSSYPLFCQAGILVHELLEKLGAKPALPLQKIDTDYQSIAKQWQENIGQYLQNNTSTTATAKTVTSAENTSHKKHYKGTIQHKVILNDRGSNKETYHIEINTDEALQYQPGDALGIYPKNKESDVQQIIQFFNENAERKIVHEGVEQSLFNIVQNKNIRGLSKQSVEKIATIFDIKPVAERSDLIDILPQNVKKDIQIEALIDILLPIAPRLYSIASATEAHDNQVHLTVNLNTFIANGIAKIGLASQFLADFPLDTEIEFYIHPNHNFRLPEDDKPVIMIGPGTGIAPFRSFLSHRDAVGAEGKNWLFFGEQHFVSDFYYQVEIQEWLSTGVLTRFDAAFSRDQEQKIYVQDRIRQRAKEFNEWLIEGASIYICGQKSPMSVDVENTIIDVIAEQQRISLDEAREFLENLETEGKYQKDVY